MNPNTLDPVRVDQEAGIRSVQSSTPSAPPEPATPSSDSYYLKLFQLIMNLIVHILIGAVVSISVIFSCQNGWPTNATLQHIVWCVIGYQLLMSQAILSMSPSNGWSAHLRVVHRRRTHWMLVIVGSGLAIAGSAIKIIDKSVHGNSLHGIFGIIAVIFTVLSLLNGVTSLWAFELRRCLPSRLSKITHILFGIVAFASSSLSLCYGFNKMMFRGWQNNALADTLIAFTTIFTFIIIMRPCVSFFSKVFRVVS